MHDEELAFEELLQRRMTPGIYQKLKCKSVLVIGLGGLGSYIVTSLARSGVGTIVGVDFDRIEVSNLGRQQYFISQIGMKKTLAMAQLIEQINPFIQFVPIEQKVDQEAVIQLAQDVDLVIEAVDHKETKVMIVQTVLTAFKDKKVISASGMAGYFDSNLIETRKINERFYCCGDGQYEVNNVNGVIAPRVGIVALHQANLAVKLLVQ